MATVAPTVTVVGSGDKSIKKIAWANVCNADTCSPVQLAGYADKSIQVAGTFDTVSVALQGSNDGTNFYPLQTPASSAIAITAAGIKAVLENTEQIRPAVSIGGNNTNISITVLARLANPLRT